MAVVEAIKIYLKGIKFENVVLIQLAENDPVIWWGFQFYFTFF
jgi:hypothetical protein